MLAHLNINHLFVLCNLKSTKYLGNAIVQPNEVILPYQCFYCDLHFSTQKGFHHHIEKKHICVSSLLVQNQHRMQIIIQYLSNFPPQKNISTIAQELFWFVNALSPYTCFSFPFSLLEFNSTFALFALQDIINNCK